MQARVARRILYQRLVPTTVCLYAGKGHSKLILKYYRDLLANRQLMLY